MDGIGSWQQAKVLGWVVLACIALVGVISVVGQLLPADESGSPSVGSPSAPLEIIEDAVSGATAGQDNARRAAENYLDTMPFSRSGLIKQLQYEGYSRADAAYGVEAVSPDWNEQAARAAQHYLDTMPFSRSSLIHQLKYEGFTPAQAVYGVNQTGL
jgi:hypothetical protein